MCIVADGSNDESRNDYIRSASESGDSNGMVGGGDEGTIGSTVAEFMLVVVQAV